MDVDFVLERTRDSVSPRPIQRKRSFRDWESRTLAMLGKNLTSEFNDFGSAVEVFFSRDASIAILILRKFFDYYFLRPIA